MMEEGAIDEVRTLLNRGLDPALPVMKAVGVREIGAHLAGRITREEAFAATLAATRAYVKRQFTWFRHQLKAPRASRMMVIDQQFSERILPEIFSFIRQFLLTPDP